MATQTTNYHLTKPAYSDTADIADINANMDTIDGQMKSNADGVSANNEAIANIATVITGTTNNSGHAISAGEYFIANGAKYKATSTIGTGVTWSDKSSSVSDHDLINALNANKTGYQTFLAYVTKNGGTESINVEIGSPIKQFLVIASCQWGNALEYVGILVNNSSGTHLTDIKTVSALSVSVSGSTITLTNNSTTDNANVRVTLFGQII